MFDVRLRLYSDVGVRGRVLLADDIVHTTTGGTPTLSFTVSERVAGNLDAPFLVGVEYKTGERRWVRPRNDLFIAREESGDSIDQTSTVTFTAEGLLGWWMRGYPLWWRTGDVELVRAYENASPGWVLKDLITSAQEVQGWAPSLTLGFGITNDSAGKPWKEKITQNWPLFTTTLATVVQSLSEQGYIEWWTEGVKLMAVNSGTGLDLTQSVVLGGPGFTRAPAKSEFNPATRIVVQYDEGWTHFENPGADARFGAWFQVMSQSGAPTRAAAEKNAQPALTAGRALARELSYEWTPTDATPTPGLDFEVGDLVTARTRRGKVSQRVIGTVVSKRSGTVTMSAFVGSRMLTLTSKLAKRSAASTVGTVIGGSGAGAAPVQMSGTAPLAPTGLRVAANVPAWTDEGSPLATVTLAWNAVAQAVDGTPVDAAMYEVWAREPGGQPVGLVSTESTSATVEGFRPGRPQLVKVRARSRARTWSAFSPEISVTAVRDTTPPAKPAPPVAVARLGQIVLTWSGLTADGDPQPTDFSHALVYMASSAGGAGSAVGRMNGKAGDTFVAPQQPYNVTRWFWLVSVDTSANRSAASDKAPATVVPLVDTDMIGRTIDASNIKLKALLAENIADQAILKEKLADNAVSLAKLDNIARDAITDAQATATTANGRVTMSTSAPTTANGVGKPPGAMWYLRDGSGQVIRMWEWTGSAPWEARTLTDAVISNFNAGSITAGFIDVARLRAGTITTNKLSVGNFTNLLDDPGLTLPLGAGAWSAASGSESSVAIVSTTGGPGPALRITSAAGSTVRVNNGARWQVVPGEEYIVSCRAQNSMDSPLNLTMYWTDADGAYLSNATRSFPVQNWRDYTSAPYVAPDGAGFAYFAIQAPASAVGTAWIQKVGVFKRVTAELLVDGAVTARAIKAKEITGEHIFGRTITGEHISGNTITAFEIASRTIIADNIASEAIIGRVIKALTIETGHLKANLVTTDKLDVGAVDATSIKADAVTTDKLNANAITAKHTITGAKFQTSAAANRGIEITSAALTAYTSTGDVAVRISATDGSATFTGTIRNKITGPRVEILSSDNRAIIYMRTANLAPSSASIASDPDGEGLLLYSGRLVAGDPIASFQLYEGAYGDTPAYWLGLTGNPGYRYPQVVGYYNGKIRISREAEHYVHMDSSGNTWLKASTVYVSGNFSVSGSKNFITTHPTKPGWQIKHASTESPHNGVEYWSDGFVQIPATGVLNVALPEYFEALTAADHRVVTVTAGAANADLWASPITGGAFTIHGAPGTPLTWVVKARRVQMSDGVDLIAFDAETLAEQLEPVS